MTSTTIIKEENQCRTTDTRKNRFKHETYEKPTGYKRWKERYIDKRTSERKCMNLANSKCIKSEHKEFPVRVDEIKEMWKNYFPR